MEEVLRFVIMKFHCKTAVKEEVKEDEQSTIRNKTGRELLEIDLDNSTTLLGKKRVFIGKDASSLIKTLDLNPKSSQPLLQKCLQLLQNSHINADDVLRNWFEEHRT